MPFKSEEQRRYLWANEPEIARDWTETYGSRIEKNIGGIMRVPFRFGGGYQGKEASPVERTSQREERNVPALRTVNYPANQPDMRVDPGFQNALRNQPMSRQDIITNQANRDYGQFFGSSVPVHTPLTLGQRIGQGIGNIGQGIGNVASRVGDYIKGGGMWGSVARGLGSLFGSGWNTTMGPRQDMGYNPNRVNPFFTPERDPREGGDISIPLWAQLGYPSYEAWAAAQGIRGIEGINIDETEVDDFVQRFRLPDEYRQNPYTVDTPIKYT